MGTAKGGKPQLIQDLAAYISYIANSSTD